MKKAGYRMRDLCALTGLERQTVHYYIQEGLLPEGHKTGKNSALYDEEHLERLRLIRKLQQERFLPLRAIRAVLGGKDQSFSRAQRALLADVRSHLEQSSPALAGGNKPSFVSVASLTARTQVSGSDIDELAKAGLVALDTTGHRLLSEDAWLVELWGELRGAGLTEDRGFGIRDIVMIDESLSELFRKERTLFLDRLSELPAREIATLISAVVPLLGRLLAGLHHKKTKDTLLVGASEVKPKRSNKRSAA